MRTDSTRVSPDAVERRARVHRDDVRQRRSSPRSRTSSSRRRTRRTRTRRSARRRSSYPPETRAQAPEGRAVQALQADLGPLRREPDERRGLRPDERRHRGEVARAARRTACARAAASSSSRAGSRSYGRGRPKAEQLRRRRRRRRRGERRQGRRSRSPRTTRRRFRSSPKGEALALVTPPGVVDRAEVHAAAAALQRRLARARARGARHRPAEHVRRDHQQGAGARLRREDRRRRASRRRRSASSSSTGSSSSKLDFMDPAFTSKMEEELDEVEAGKEERVDSAQALLQALPQAARQEQEGQALEPGAGADGRESATTCDERRDDEALVEERLVPRLRELPEVQEHARPRAPTATARRRRARPDIDVRQVRQADGHPQRPLRRVPLVHRLPECKNAQARSARRAVPEVRRRHHRDPPRRSAAARRSTAARTTNDEPSSATSSSGRSRSTSRARCARRRSSCMAGNKRSR